MSSATYFPSEEHYHAVSDSENSTENDDNVFRLNDKIIVVAGKYVGRSGFVRKVPVKWIPLFLDATPTQKSAEVCLPPTSVKKVGKTARRSSRREEEDAIMSPPSPSPSTTSAAPSTTGSENSFVFASRHQQGALLLDEEHYHAVSDSEGSTESDDNVFRIGDAIQVVAGKYKERSGIVRKTPVKLIPVLLDATSTQESKETCLAPTSLKKIRNAERRSYHGQAGEHIPAASQSPGPAVAPIHINNSLLSLPGYQHDKCFIVPDSKQTTYGPTLASKLFDLVNYSLPVNKSCPAIPIEWTESGHKLELIATKIHAHKMGYQKQKMTVYTLSAHYCIAKEGLLETLEDYAAFGLLPPRKVASRLELLFTPAMKNHRQVPTICDDITTDHIEMLPDDDSVYSDGCGFVPRWVIEKLFGTLTDGKRTFAFMARILAPQLGLIKGVLMEKNDIEKIQLHPSMIKVPPSQRNPTSTKVILLASRSYPSENNLQVARLFRGDKAPRKSFVPNKLKHMATNVLEANQVPKSVTDKYVKSAASVKGLEHSFVLGASDPTNAIPPGNVFLSGFSDELPDHILVTRFPCTEASDLLKLPLVKTKPHQMDDKQWDFLNNLHFGAILFGNPGNGHGPLPPMIANGDLDGDLYMVMWNKEMLSYVPVADTSLVCTQTKKETKFNDEWNANWLNDARVLMCDIGSLRLRQMLIGKLHNLWKESVDHAKQVAFGRAYKEALDIGKHGGQVPLPREFWSDLKEEFHGLLEDVSWT